MEEKLTLPGFEEWRLGIETKYGKKETDNLDKYGKNRKSRKINEHEKPREEKEDSENEENLFPVF